jgi:protein subunit release factor B
MQDGDRVTILSQKDLKVSYFCGSGAGGTNRNKVASGVLIQHEESGASGRASDSRCQIDNKRSAWDRLLKDPKMKFWLAKQVYAIRQGETLEQTVAKDMDRKNLKIEVKDENGRWVEDLTNASE